MKSRMILATTILAGITFSAAPAIAAEEPQNWINPVSPIYFVAESHGETITGPVYFAPNQVPFAKADSGNIVVGDGDDPAHTRTWIPFTDQTVYLPIDGSTVIDSVPDGAEPLKGAILAKYLATGGEARWGQSTSAEMIRYDGVHAGAVPVTVQTFDKADAHWTKTSGARILTGAIKVKHLQLGSLRGPGYAVTDEYTVTVNGKQYQEQRFSHGTVIRWSASTGAFEVK